MMEKELVIKVADLVTIITEAQKGRDYNFMCDRGKNGRYITSIAFFDAKTHFKTQEVGVRENSPHTPQNTTKIGELEFDNNDPDLDNLDVSDFIGKKNHTSDELEQLIESMGDNEDF